MAYLCADSGNLMAIAQQVIKQKQQQEEQQQHKQNYQNQQLCALTSSLPHASSSAQSSFSYGFSTAGFAEDGNLTAFNFPNSCEGFNSDEWMDNLMSGGAADSTDSSNLASACDAWRNPHDFDADSPSELSRLFLPNSSGKSNPAPQLPSWSAPNPNFSSDAAPISPILKCLIECASLSESEPLKATQSLCALDSSISESGTPTQRVAFYFSQALRIKLRKNTLVIPSKCDPLRDDFTLSYKALNDAVPNLKFAHLTANQAILEACQEASMIHVIDFGIMQGVQWAALLQALATRPSGKPTRIRISGIPSPPFANSLPSSLISTGNRLREFAKVLDLNFEFHPILSPIDSLTPLSFSIDPQESLAVNFMLQLYNILDETPDPVVSTLKTVKSLRPKIVTLVEHEVNLNDANYPTRFASGLKYYSALFESLAASLGSDCPERRRIERKMLGRSIARAIGEEAGKKRERMMEREEWKTLIENSNLAPVSLSHYAISQAKILLWNYNYSSQYSLIETSPSFLSLAWNRVPLVTVSCWH